MALFIIWFIPLRVVAFNQLLACNIACFLQVWVTLNSFLNVLVFNRLMLSRDFVWRQMKITIYTMWNLCVYRQYRSFIWSKFLDFIKMFTIIRYWLLHNRVLSYLLPLITNLLIGKLIVKSLRKNILDLACLIESIVIFNKNVLVVALG